LRKEIDLYLRSEGVSYHDLIAGERSLACGHRRSPRPLMLFGALALSLATWFSW
jgi:hypothetical protein